MNENPSDQEIGGWIVHANSRGSGYTHKAGALTAALDNLGPKGFSIMLQMMKLNTAMDVVEWMAGK